MNNNFNASFASDSEKRNRASFYELFKNNPLPEDEILNNLGLFINRQNLSRILLMHELYKKIIEVNGVVMEFGVRWGQNLCLFEIFRAIYEPYNYTRKIIGFDTFEGFKSVHQKDGKLNRTGDYSVTPLYEEYLKRLLNYHESESPVAHIKKSLLIKGDAIVTLEEYLEQHTETIIAFAYFDFDLYEPTKKCLELIKDRVTKGSIIAFDELNHPGFPGETQAFLEVIGVRNCTLKRSPLAPYVSYIVVE
ncbi:crotonobetainyl-CoA--carnitine CoA-transferase [Schinkia azotoformans]|uniref:crotonobetainyl-CoA--carnitine CoA-transferase n=1 Tax=Schinkia azotoformans TaxID=1454 RepID=UPI002DBBBD0E|nr:crotonobetainyl-CoA--carnitine CoA-transferase [Schinkia azotoformans]MEC1715545.1 TylF/MycF/NovP-related O-methyltransferase [Schinkia azotoformans]MEC1743431.1 TylF/MycF/NovP-related O-methyltransferase [Schinkia azotoformans]MEC1747975.1 TylF/MycF/NovP-related O-methyltransferase [Schinkia azotoformans]MEC1758338.1 TylF/MycF/NovP-related O-methyltransferase [Schinkia azotoformans]MEC1768373.1 TylF/MycF/NovP-related O-methyltransferase [Schinkia azotoformans]